MKRRQASKARLSHLRVLLRRWRPTIGAGSPTSMSSECCGSSGAQFLKIPDLNPGHGGRPLDFNSQIPLVCATRALPA